MFKRWYYTLPELKYRKYGRSENHTRLLFVMELFRTLENVLNRMLMLTVTILGTVIFQFGESKIISNDQFKFQISQYNSLYLL